MAPTPGNDRDKALEAALAQIERQFGKGSVMRLGEEGRAPIEAIPTGSIALDIALGIGGLPKGRVIEVYGPESSGKTTVALANFALGRSRGLVNRLLVVAPMAAFEAWKDDSAISMVPAPIVVVHSGPDSLRLRRSSQDLLTGQLRDAFSPSPKRRTARGSTSIYAI